MKNRFKEDWKEWKWLGKVTGMEEYRKDRWKGKEEYRKDRWKRREERVERKDEKE